MKYQVGDIVTGLVISIKPYGAFINIDNKTTGLLHISEMSYDYVKDIHNLMDVNQTIKVKIIGINRANQQIILSRKVLTKPRRKTKNKPRYRYQVELMETKKGFNELAKQLEIWINEYGGEDKW